MNRGRLPRFLPAVAAAVLALAAGLAVGLLWSDRDDGGAPSGALTHLLAQKVPDATGQPVDIGHYRGRVIVVNFWATWCPPCVQEMPEISEVNDEFAADGVVVLGLGVDTANRIEAFGRKLTVSYPLFALDAAGLDVLRDFGNESGALPYTLVFDRSGREVARKLGRISKSELRQAVEAALARG